MSEYKIATVALRASIAMVLNAHNIDGITDTPDYVLANYLGDCLDAYNSVVQEQRIRNGLPESSASLKIINIQNAEEKSMEAIVTVPYAEYDPASSL